MLFTFLASYTKDGVTYESESMKILQKVTIQSIEPSFEVPSSVEEIIAGSSLNSAFYFCKDHIGAITFQKNSKIKKLGDALFESTSITSIDMSNCDQLTTISKLAFNWTPKLSKIILPPNVKIINESAFSNSIITEIDFPDSLEEIFSYSFAIPTLFTVNIGSGSNLTSIGSHAFMYTIIPDFFIPKGLVDISSAIFVFGRTKHFTIDPLNSVFTLDDRGITVFANEGKSIVLVANYINEPYVCASTVTEIKNQAFRSTSFSSVTLSDNITVINWYVFAATKITELIASKKLEHIYGYAFEDSQLQRIVLPDSLTIIDEYAFRNAVNLVNITLPSTLTEIKEFAFCRCLALREIVIPMKVEKFGSSVFALCSKDLRIIFLNESKFTNIDGMLFVDKSKLVDYFPESDNAVLAIPDYCTSIPSFIFADKSIKTITFNERTLDITINERAFKGSTLESITLPPTLTALGVGCFEKCINLNQISFSQTNLTFIPEACFLECTALQKVTFADSIVEEIHLNAFKLSGVANADFENSVIERFMDNCFLQSKLVKITLPSTLTTLGFYSFSSCLELEEVSLVNCENLTAIEKHSFSFDSSLTSVILGPNVENLAEDCFRECTALTHFELAQGTKFLQPNCFYHCSNLEYITIPNDSMLQTIFPFALDKCNKLTRFEILDTAKFNFKNGALLNGNFTKLLFYLPSTKNPSIVIAGTVNEIADYAFHSCTTLYEVIVSDGNLRRIGYQAFKGCKNIRRLLLPQSIQEINQYAFEGCTNLRCGCVFIPEHAHREATENGKIDKGVLDSQCQSKICPIFFDRVSCKYHNIGAIKFPLVSLASLFISCSLI